MLLIFTLFAALCLSATNEAYGTYRSLSDDGSAFAQISPAVSLANPSSAMFKNGGVDVNSKIYSVVGKSQILKFDQSIKRVSIANPNIADVIVISPQQLMINGKQTGSTSLIFWGDSNVPSFYNLVVQQDADAFIQAVNHIAPNEDVTILFNDTGAVLSGQVSSTNVKERIKDLAKAYKLDLLDLSESPAKQVLLEVKVVEVSKNFSRELSSNILGSDQSGTYSSSIFEGVVPYLNDKEYGKVVPSATRFLELKDGVRFLFTDKDSKYAAQFYASDKKGNVKILAEPKLLTADGKEGSFTVGNEVPVPSNIGLAGQVSYSFKKTGVILNFTPHIMEDSNRIRLNLAPEISEIDRSIGDATAPGFKTRKVETTVELQSGETLIIAGLLNSSVSKNKTQVPILGEIPILGLLFRSSQDNKSNTEVIIFITPHIVDSKTSINQRI